MAMDSNSAVVIFLIGLFVWDKYNKGSEKAELVSQDILDLVPDWKGWKTKGDNVLTTLWNGDLCKKEPALLEDSRLKCWWHTGHSSFLLLGPLKKEVVSVFPRIVIFHDFITEDEVDTIKMLAIPKLHAAGVGEGDEARVDKGVRDAKHAWLLAQDNPAIWAIQQRTQEATGLNMVTSEALQVGRYGVGGHYKPHFDHDHLGTDMNPQGNRIATILMYMEKVDNGGFTVFPELNLAIRPQPRSAVFWYNLRRSRAGDPRTLHAACPVEGVGKEKWVINYWVRERGEDTARNVSVMNYVPL
eukprot:GFUD01004096.1.p1 GENE.GFUD01004096.1~~GFUD01004096.1.p1  ORF type:complete len:300 (-),score=84.17 GFUD01004096.1:102-1001(-)